MGLEALASDLNPVAVLINKAQIEIPPRFAGRPPVHPDQAGAAELQQWSGARGLAADVRYYGRWMRDEAQRRIGHLYPKVDLPPEHGGGEANVIAWLWARTVRSPDPAWRGHVPLVKSFMLSNKKGRRAWVEPVVDRATRAVLYEVRSDGDGEPPAGTVTRQGARCLATGAAMPFSYIREEGRAGRMGQQLMAIVAEGTRQRVYLEPLAKHAEAADLDVPQDVPLGEPLGKARANVANYGLTGWADLFTARQLTALPTFCDLVAEARRRAQVDAAAAGLDDAPSPLRDGGSGAAAYAEAISVYLGLIVGKVADRLSTIATWDSNVKFEGIRNTFARQAIPMTWDFAEGNPFSASTGSTEQTLDWVGRVLDDICVTNPGSVSQLDAAEAPRAFQSRRQPEIGPGPENGGHSSEGQEGSRPRSALGDAPDFSIRHSGEEHAPDSILGRNPRPSRPTGAARELRSSHPGLLVSTDPPYYDNIGYADLSDFFYVWLRRCLGSVYPDVCATLLVPKAQELVATPYRFDGDRRKAEEFFESGLNRVFERLAEAQDERFPMTVYYAFKQAETTEGGVASTGWETILQSLINAGLVIVGTWPIATELRTKPVALGANALASSIVLVCRRRSASAPLATRREFLRALEAELPEALRLLREGGIAPVDMAQAAIGPGMAVFSRYGRVMEASGETMRVRKALELINETLDEATEGIDAEFDYDTRWAVSWFAEYGFTEGEFGRAELLSKSRNTSVAGLAEAGIVESGAGKVRLLRRDELDPDWDPATDDRFTVWEVAHHLIGRMHEEGEGAAAALLGAVGGHGEAAKELAYRLYLICERKGWATEALDYNSLVTSWPELTKLAATAPTTQAALL